MSAQPAGESVLLAPGITYSFTARDVPEEAMEVAGGAYRRQNLSWSRANEERMSQVQIDEAHDRAREALNAEVNAVIERELTIDDSPMVSSGNGVNWASLGAVGTGYTGVEMELGATVMLDGSPHVIHEVARQQGTVFIEYRRI